MNGSFSAQGRVGPERPRIQLGLPPVATILCKYSGDDGLRETQGIERQKDAIRADNNLKHCR